MNQQSIQRVDQLIKNNNIKYIDQRSQKQYEKALQQFEKNKKKESLLLYNESIKQVNKRNIEKKKQLQIKKKNNQKKIKIKKQQSKPQQKQQTRIRINKEQKKIIDETIEAKAERHLHQAHLHKLNIDIEKQKKKNKLIELNNKVRKIINKPILNNEGQGAVKETLKKLQNQAMQEVHRLDNIIKQIKQQQKSQIINPNNRVNKRQQEKQQLICQRSEFIPRMQYSIFDNEHLLFSKCSEQLLELDYIPL